MRARIASRLSLAVIRWTSGFALLAAASTSPNAAPALGPYVWPVDGAPLCNAAGDQHGLFYATTGCNDMLVGWVASLGVDSLASNIVGAIPPTGDCRSYPPRIDAPGVSEPSTAEVRSNLVGIALPYYCIGPEIPAVVWKQGSGASSQIVVHNGYWRSPFDRVVVDDGDFVRHHPGLAGSGTVPDTAVVVVWSDERTGVPQIRAQRVTWSGQREWGVSGLLIAPTGAAQTEPDIVRLQDGSTLVAWLDARSGGSDVYALKLLVDGSVAPGWPATGLALEARPEASSGLRLETAEDYSGVSYAVWEESGARFGGGRSIVVRRLEPGGVPTPGWDPLGVVLSSSPTVEHLQDVGLTGTTLVAVWTDTRAASAANPTDLYAQRMESSGALTTGWPASGLAICTAPGRQDAARVSAADSYAAFAWEDHRGADSDVYAELRYADGTLPAGLWVPNGLPATSAAGDQTAPVVGVGNGGGCFVAWEDARDVATNGLDIYAQAFTSEGDKLDAPPVPLPRALALGAPRPNPMRSSSVFTVEVPRGGSARVEVIDVAGRRVRTIVAGDLPAGSHELVFDGRDDAGRELPPGLYRVHARTASESSSRALVRVH